VVGSREIFSQQTTNPMKRGRAVVFDGSSIDETETDLQAALLLACSAGVGQIMISHTMSDLLALPAEEDRMKALGFVERSGMVICGGLPASEMPLLTSAIPQASW
jgi:hypothetical protein